MKRLILLALVLTPFLAHAAQGKPVVLVTLPAAAALVQEVAGDTVEVTALARGDEDPHFVQATPLLMRRARDASALFEVGLRLEPWVDNVAAGSGNPRIQRGTPGRVVLGEGISTLEVPTRIDAAQGDLHPQGNPHLWLDPVRAKAMAANAAAALARLFPDHAATYRENLASFKQRLDEALYGPELIALVSVPRLDRAVLSGELHTLLAREFQGRPLGDRSGGWLAKAAPLRGVKMVEHHQVWIYFAATFGLERVGVIEEYPGVRPGPGHLERLIALMRREGVRLVLVDDFYERNLPAHVADKAGAALVVLPNQVQPGMADYFGLMETILDRLLAGLAERE